MKLATLIIDDEPIALEKLRKYVEKTETLTLTAACSNGFEALQIIKSDSVDLIITDINMPDLNGLEFVRSLNPRPLVIFTTAHSQYAVDSYKVSAVDYLLKPYGFDSFTNAIAKATEIRRLHDNPDTNRQTPPTPLADDSLFVKVDYRYLRISLSDIRFIKGYGEYLQIYIEGKSTPIVTLSSFAAIKKNLPENFIQVHRSYIINMNRVQQIERSRIIMDSDNYIPVGDSYKSEFQSYLSRHSIAPR